MSRLIQLLSAFIITASLIGCTSVGTQRSYPPEMFAAEITRLEAGLLNSSNPTNNWRSHLELVHLYINYKNPSHDYGKALEHLEQYYLSRPESDDDNELRDWLAVLKSHGTLEQSNGELRKLNQKLEQSNSELKDNNQKLVNTIDILKTLDQGVEEKRKSFNDK